MAKKKMISARRFAQIHDVPKSTVMTWLQKGRIAGAVSETLTEPYEVTVYKIPENAKLPDLKRGPVPKPKPAKKAKKR